MQPKKNNTLVITLCVVIVLGLVWVFWYFSPKEKFNWYESYKIDDKEPYGVYVAGELLRNYVKPADFTVSDTTPVHRLLALKENSPHSSYVFIGEALFLDSADVETMLDYVRNGNDVFISSQELPRSLTINLQDFQCYWKGYRYYADSTAQMNFYHANLQESKPYSFSYMRKDEVLPYYWAWFDPGNLCGYRDDFSKLGYFHAHNDSDRVNFVRFPYGKGYFYFHTTPLVFTNFFLVHGIPLDYAAKVMSHLKPGPFYWDEYSKIPHYQHHGDNDMGQSESPLQFLLQQKSMRWAWFTLIFGVVLTYLLFRTKRRQRIIPLLEPNANTSLEFVQTIGRLYFLQNNHRGLCKQMMRYFLAFIRNKYYLSTARINDELIVQIAQRSKVNTEAVRKIFNAYNLIDKTAAEISDNELISFHQSLEYFYKNCK